MRQGQGSGLAKVMENSDWFVGAHLSLRGIIVDEEEEALQCETRSRIQMSMMMTAR